MFNAVDCIEPKYQAYGTQPEPSPDTSQDAAAATAAANVLMKLVPNSNVKQQLADYLAKTPDGPAKDRGVKIGEDAAAKTIEMREKDGATARNAYRPNHRTRQIYYHGCDCGVLDNRCQALRFEER